MLQLAIRKDDRLVSLLVERLVSLRAIQGILLLAVEAENFPRAYPLVLGQADLVVDQGNSLMGVLAVVVSLLAALALLLACLASDPVVQAAQALNLDLVASNLAVPWGAVLVALMMMAPSLPS